MKLKDALTLQEGLDPAIVKDIVDIAMRSEFGKLSGMNKVAEKEWEDISQLIRYIKEAIPTTTHYLFDTLVSKLDDRLPDTEIDQNLNEKYGLPGNVGREFGEKFMRDFIESGKFANLWTAFEATYPELQPELQSTFEKTNELLRYIKPEKGDETYRISSMPEIVAQELNDLLDNALETIDFVSDQNQQPSKEMVIPIIKEFNNIFEDMLTIFTSNTLGDTPLKPYKQSKIGFKEDALNKSKSNYSSWKKDNKIMKMKKLSEIYASGHKETISGATEEYKELQLAWRNLDDEQRLELLLSFVKDPHDEPNMEWEQLWNEQPMLANNPDFQEALLAANFGGNGVMNEDHYFWTVVGNRGDGQVQYGPNYKTEAEAQKAADIKNNQKRFIKSGISFSVQQGSIYDEGTCGYSVDGDGGDKPAGSHLLKKSDIREMIKKQIKEMKNPNSKSTKLSDLIKEASFDDRLKAKMGMSDDEFEDQVASRDIGDGGSSFPGDESGYSPVAAKARDYIETFKKEYREMSDDQLDEFSVEIINHLLDNTAAQAAAKIFFGKRSL